MSKVAFRVAFDGEALASHTMDVRDLAPALMGLSEALIEANKILNGKETALEVHITPDIEENCFDIGIEVLQHWGPIKDFFSSSDAVAAKELAEWVLINWKIVGGVVSGLLLLYKTVLGKRPINAIHFKDENGNPLVRMQFKKGPDEIVDERIYPLYMSDKIRTQLGRLLGPLLRRDGITSFAAYKKGERDKAIRVTKGEARDIDFTPAGPEEEDNGPEPGEPFEAMLKVYSPVYDLNAQRWRFWYGKEHVYMDVSESNIREFVLKHGGALIEDWFRVMLQIEENEDDDGKKVHTYKVLDVLDFIPAFRQGDMLAREHKPQEGSGDEEGDPNKRS